MIVERWEDPQDVGDLLAIAPTVVRGRVTTIGPPLEQGVGDVSTPFVLTISAVLAGEPELERAELSLPSAGGETDSQIVVDPDMPVITMDGELIAFLSANDDDDPSTFSINVLAPVVDERVSFESRTNGAGGFAGFLEQMTIVELRTAIEDSASSVPPDSAD